MNVSAPRFGMAVHRLVHTTPIIPASLHPAPFPPAEAKPLELPPTAAFQRFVLGLTSGDRKTVNYKQDALTAAELHELMNTLKSTKLGDFGRKFEIDIKKHEKRPLWGWKGVEQRILEFRTPDLKDGVPSIDDVRIAQLLLPNSQDAVMEYSANFLQPGALGPILPRKKALSLNRMIMDYRASQGQSGGF